MTLPMEMNGERSVETITERRCVGSDGRIVQLFERRHVIVNQTAAGPRRYVGARFWCTSTGEPVRLIDNTMFEVVESGELLLASE